MFTFRSFSYPPSRWSTLTPILYLVKIILVMPTNRKITFINDGIYHIYNRGVERRALFTNRREYSRAFNTFAYYQYAKLPLKYSKYITLERADRTEFFKAIALANNKLVEILAYALMPNHFHFLLKQVVDNGISSFVSRFTNSYTKYYNIRNDRVGPLVQGVFKASYVENDDLLVHVSRYIHINHVVGSIITIDDLEKYPWSSFHEYLNKYSVDATITVCNTDPVLNLFASREDYRNFVRDQVEYGLELEKIKHLCFDE